MARGHAGATAPQVTLKFTRAARRSLAHRGHVTLTIAVTRGTAKSRSTAKLAG